MSTDHPACDLPGLPRDDSGPVFGAPWQAQAFALALALHERGVFTWPEWAAALTDAIRRARQDRARNYLEALRAQAKVVDRREGLFPTSAQAEAAATSALGQSNGI